MAQFTQLAIINMSQGVRYFGDMQQLSETPFLYYFNLISPVKSRSE